MDGGCAVEETVPSQLGAKMKALCPDTCIITAVGNMAPLSPMGSFVLLDHKAHLREDF